MTQNLLTKTLRWYVVFAVIVLLITAPIFYLVTQHLYIHEANETLRHRKKEFVRYHLPYLKIEGIENWNRHNHDEKIVQASNGKRRKDKFSTAFYYDTLAHEDEPYRILISPITIEGRPYTFVAKINLVERDDLMQSIALLFLGLITAMLVGLYFITRIMSVKLWKPFYIALDHIEQFEVDKSKAINLTVTDINEFTRLNNAIEELIQKNTKIYSDQKEFVENAAHELQTPLAVIQGKLETLFQQSNLTLSQSEILEKLNEAVARLSRLNKNLLLLSRIEHDQFTESMKHYEFFSEQASSKNILIKIESDEEVSIKANPTLTEVLFNNLFLNAIRHNLKDGRILITLTENHFTIGNTGSDSPLLEEKIFDRFSKINPSTQGSGLGLAIVKKIADLNHWVIQYTFQNNLHTFSINF